MTITNPDQIHDTFAEAVNAKDVDALLDLYETDGLAIGLDGSEITGYEPMLAMCEGLTGAIRHIEGSTRKVYVSGDVALTSGSWTAEIVLPDGSVITQQGTNCEVSRRQADGSWKVVIDDPTFV